MKLFVALPCRGRSIHFKYCIVQGKHEWVELRREGGPNLSASDAALMAYAAGLITWARKNLHSTQSGSPLKPLQGGHAR